MRSDALCGLLAEPDRLAVFASVVLGATNPAGVAKATGLDGRTVTAALRRLIRGGLVTVVDGMLTADAGPFKQAVREARPGPEPGEPLDPDRSRAAILRRYVRDGRLVQIPMTWSKRRLVLEHIAASFEPGIRYPEREVNAVLRAWHPDYASLRRYLVDEALLARESGVYWRIGGQVHIDQDRESGQPARE
jgi:hypothetical protein